MRTQQQILNETSVRHAFTQGYACALVQMLKYDGQDTAITREVFKAQLGSIAKCVRSGVDEFDIEELKKYFK